MIKKNQDHPSVANKNIYRYLPTYGVSFNDENYKKQRVKRRDLLNMRNNGYLEADVEFSRYTAMMRCSKRIRGINLNVSTTSETVIPYGRFGELREALKKQSSLHNIVLSLDVTMDDDLMKRLTSGMKRLVNLKGISLQIGYKQQQITDQGIKDLSQCFKRLHALKSLNLRLYSCCRVTDQGYQALGAGLGKLVTLQNLSLLSNSSNITEKGLQTLVQGFKLSTTLQNIRLSFKWLEINGLEKMRDNLKEMSYLQKIVIDFVCQSFDDNESLQRLSHELKGLAFIKNLYLENLAFCETPHEGLEIVNQAFEELHLLNGLSLDFVMLNYETPENIHAFNQTLKKLSSLKTLHINFQRCYFHGKEINVVVSLSDALKELTSLKSLYLELDFKVSDKGLQALNQAFRELQQLESFELTIFDGSVFSSQGLQELKENLQQMKSLQKLGLTFYDNTVINGNELQIMLGGLEGLASFKNISLEFQKCSKISNQDLRVLSESLKKIASLKSIYLRFTRCQVNEDGVLELCESFKRRFYCKVDYNSDGNVKTFFS